MFIPRKQRGWAWLSWAIPAAVSAFGYLSGSKAQKQTNEANARLAAENRAFQDQQAGRQMAFQEEMANSAHQREVRDLQAAGINPMLSSRLGGAAVPSGSSGGGAQATMENPVGAGVASASQAMQTVSALQTMAQSQAQTENIAAQTRKIQSETFSHDVNSAIRAAELQRVNYDVLHREEDVRHRRHEVERIQRENQLGRETFSAAVARAKAESELKRLEIPRMKGEADFFGDVGSGNRYLQMLMDLIRGWSHVKGK